MNFLKRIIAGLRPIENINVKIYADNKNSEEIKIKDVRPADIITMLETGPGKERNHMLLITENNKEEIKYVHSRAWSSEGRYGHGVCEGIIKIVEPTSDPLKQQWIENEKTGEQNETFLEAKNARVLQIRRIKI